MAERVDIYIDQGATFSFAFNANDDDDNALDLTGYTSSAQLRKYYNATDSVAFLTSIANTNQITLSLTAAQTANLVDGRYVYDCEIVDGGTNNVTRVIEGVVTVRPSVTR